MGKSGIYCITNIVNGKVYIGQAKDINKRKYTHFNLLKNNKHGNKHLQSAWNKNPDELIWSFEIIEYCEKNKEILDDRETHWIASYGATNPEKGYNRCSIGSSQLGTKRSKETRQKISKVHKGKIVSEASRKKMSEVRKGVKRATFSDETRQKMSEAKKGKKCGPFSESHRKALSEAQKGVKRGPMSDEVKQKIRSAKKGKPSGRKGKTHTLEARKRMSATHKGKSFSEESRLRMSEAQKKRFERQRILKSMAGIMLFP